MHTVTDDYYHLLGVDPQITTSELRSSWRQLALHWYPDRVNGQAPSKFQKVATAFAVLSDPVERAAYDKARSAAGARASSYFADAQPRTSQVPAVMLSRLTGPLESLQACGVARRLTPYLIELVVNEEEAAQGGMATISMQVFVRCPACDDPSTTRCTRCAGTRKAEARYSAWLAVPPDVRDGSVLMPSVDLPGMIRRPEFHIRRPASAY